MSNYETIAAAIRAERDRVEQTTEEREQGKQQAADAMRALVAHHQPREDSEQ